jgi:hypothetical protein
MQDIDVYADRLGFDFETLLSRIAACDEAVFEHAKKKREEAKANGGRSVPAEGGEQRQGDN